MNISFDYTKFAGAVQQMETGLANATKACETKIVNTSYASGPAKFEFDSYIKDLNDTLSKVAESMSNFYKTVNDVYTAYSTADSSLKQALQRNE